MRDDGSAKKSKLSWPKTFKKWFSIRGKAVDSEADYSVHGGVDEEWGNIYSEREPCTIRKSKTERLNKRSSDLFRRGNVDAEVSQVTDVQNYRLFVATWNVAGKSPPDHLNLEDWLHTSPAADIYILGFQEIVPLNAGNVLGTEDNGPAKKWLALIRKTLNSLPGGSGVCLTPSPIADPLVELDVDFEASRQKSSFLQRRSFQSLSRSMRTDSELAQPRLDRRFSICDRVMLGDRMNDYDQSYRWLSSDEENGPEDSPGNSYHSPALNNKSGLIADGDHSQTACSRYFLVAKKQMVGIFLTVWVRGQLRDSVHSVKVSCVGRGLMGYLGNKGSISISISLHQTTFCFICSHLTSGEKEGDELRRNSDVMEILRKTRFPRVHGSGDENSPQTILDHDRIIWLGDLNYRIALSYRYVKALVEMRNWRALLENDQLQIEQRGGRAFVGWNEGKIYFPPTYKYSNNSDRYAGENRHPKEKRRTPAWCDRILWYGQGLNQLSYVRGESRFSDHRPVYSVFLAEVESVNRGRIKKSMSCSRIEVEELLPYSHWHMNFNYFH
ncbi:hypothetical protein SAY87_006559 [Trapa incisa]|uniref:Inositol polyphosphate-related phosphatase domain-containing protein n=1 Tax=Trapa incisa TaxID=236973 RepID=A0AAN7JZW9_9MYRT|nr:hypothetical protein SAY87_006559 [Trapa incisa]